LGWLPGAICPNHGRCAASISTAHPIQGEAGGRMNFSPIQWVMLIGMDLFVRSAYAFAVSFNIFLIPIVLKLSALHIFILGLVSGFATPLAVPLRRVVTVIVTSVLFAIAMAGLWITAEQSSHSTSCFNNVCDWINGTITPSGVWLVFKETSIQVLANLSVTATTLFLGRGIRAAAS
jgi:hypothetical protein